MSVDMSTNVFTSLNNGRHVDRGGGPLATTIRQQLVCMLVETWLAPQLLYHKLFAEYMYQLNVSD